MTVGSKLILAYYWSDVENAGVLIGWKVPTGTSQTGSMLAECSLGTHLNFVGENFIFGIFTFFEEMTF